MEPEVYRALLILIGFLVFAGILNTEYFDKLLDRLFDNDE